MSSRAFSTEHLGRLTQPLKEGADGSGVVCPKQGCVTQAHTGATSSAKLPLPHHLLHKQLVSKGQGCLTSPAEMNGVMQLEGVSEVRALLWLFRKGETTSRQEGLIKVKEN